jgi:hypothetical protein
LGNVFGQLPIAVAATKRGLKHEVGIPCYQPREGLFAALVPVGCQEFPIVCGHNHRETNIRPM